MSQVTTLPTYERPDVIKRYKKQVEFIDSPTRYTIVEATTKAGKTVGCIVWIFEQALGGREGRNYWWVAPVYSQAKIAFRRLKRFISDRSIFEANETEMTITLANGAVIWFKSAEKPDNLYGEDVYGVVLDESTRMREDAWFAIRSTLTFTNGLVKIIGNVKGTGNWSYKLAREAEAGKQDWAYFKITASDAVEAGILDQAEIDDAERTYPRGVFLELYYGIPNESSSNKFCYSFDEKKHIGKCAIDFQYPIYLSFDFNYNPICCVVIQYYDETVFVPEVIKLENSNIYNLCAAIKSKIPDNLDPMFFVTGDASGKNMNALVKDNLNYYRVIRSELNIASSQIMLPLANPTMEQNQVLVNAVLEHYAVQIDPDKANSLIFDMKFAQMGFDKKLIKTDRSDPTQQLEALDGFRYYLNKFHRDFLKIGAKI